MRWLLGAFYFARECRLRILGGLYSLHVAQGGCTLIKVRPADCSIAVRRGVEGVYREIRLCRDRKGAFLGFLLCLAISEIRAFAGPRAPMGELSVRNIVLRLREKFFLLLDE